MCPDCLAKLERTVEMSFEQETKNIPVVRTWAGALSGGLAALAVWIGVLTMFDGAGLPTIAWVGIVLVAMASAMGARLGSGNRRGQKVTLAAAVCMVPAIALGYYFSINAAVYRHLLQSAERTQPLIERGILSPDFGWMLPPEIVVPIVGPATNWQEAVVLLAAVFVAYAMTHRRRLWKTGKR